MATLTEELIEEFDSRVRRNDSVDLREADGFLRGLCNARRAGDFSIDEDIDFQELFEAWAGNGDRRLGAQRLASFARSGDREIQEHTLDAMTSSSFRALVNTVIQQGTIDALENAPMTVTGLVNRNIRVDFNTNKLFGVHPIGDVVQPAEELEETPIFGLSGRTVTPPKAQKEKFALGLTRELMALDVNGLIRQRMREGAQSLALHAEKLLVDLVFGIYDPSNNPWPYIEDDISYRTYYAVGGGGPWENLIASNPPTGTFAPLQAIYDLNESLVDDYTGEPVVLEMRNILVASDSASRLFEQALGIVQIAQDTGGSGNERIAWERPADGRFRVIAKSDYARHRLTSFYQTTAGGSMSASNALAAAKNTWIAGDFQRAFGWATEWDMETLERTSPDTWEYFNQEIVLLIKYLWKVTPVVLNPRLVVKNTP